MPVVPITQARIKPKGLPDVPPPSEPFALMAAAQMHAEGRLLKDEPSGKSPLNE